MATQPVYKLFHARFTGAYHQLPDAERGQLDQRVEAALAAVGGKRIVLCESRWHNEQWDGWGVEEFPNIEAVQEHTRLLSEIGWYRYIDSVTMLGTPWQA